MHDYRHRRLKSYENIISMKLKFLGEKDNFPKIYIITKIDLR